MSVVTFAADNSGLIDGNDILETPIVLESNFHSFPIEFADSVHRTSGDDDALLTFSHTGRLDLGRPSSYESSHVTSNTILLELSSNALATRKSKCDSILRLLTSPLARDTMCRVDNPDLSHLTACAGVDLPVIVANESWERGA